LLHNLKHNKVLHARVILITITSEDMPRFDPDERIEINILEHQVLYQVIVHCGFMENPDTMQLLKELGRRGLHCKLEDTTFFLSKSSIARGTRRGILSWRGGLFRWVQKNAPPASEYFNVPPNRVIELGTQLTL
jgi:KUP system potassium uptake protein